MNHYHLHLMRHGAPEVPGLLLGWQDMASTAAGIAGCIGRAEQVSFGSILSSGLIRAAAAAEEIAMVHGLEAGTDNRWRELDFGDWDGLHPEAIDPASLRQFQNDPDGSSPPGGESWSALVARVSAAIDALPAEDVLVVTHGGAMRAALAALFGFGHQQCQAFAFPYCALLSVRIWPQVPRTAQIVGMAA